MSVKAIGEYKFPSRSRQELYGDDQLVHVMWRGNMFICAVTCFRAPKAMPWNQFVTTMVEPWAGADPDFVPGSAGSWQLNGKPFKPASEQSLAELGVGHKHVLSFATS